MIRSLHIADTDILYAPIAEGDKYSRRQRERAVVAEIVRHYAGDSAVLRHNADGAPLLDGYTISVSHSRRIAVVAFGASGHATHIGVDAEEWRDAFFRVKDRFLSADERLWATEPEQLLKAWTAKEAVFKAAGIPSLQLIDIAVSPCMTLADAAGRTYELRHFNIDGTIITLAKACNQ